MKESIEQEDSKIEGIWDGMLTILDFPVENLSPEEAKRKLEKMHEEKNIEPLKTVFHEMAAEDFFILLNDFLEKTLKKYFSRLLHHGEDEELSKLEETFFNKIVFLSFERLRKELETKGVQDAVL